MNLVKAWRDPGGSGQGLDGSWWTWPRPGRIPVDLVEAWVDPGGSGGGLGESSHCLLVCVFLWIHCVCTMCGLAPWWGSLRPTGRGSPPLTDLRVGGMRDCKLRFYYC